MSEKDRFHGMSEEEIDEIAEIDYRNATRPRRAHTVGELREILQGFSNDARLYTSGSLAGIGVCYVMEGDLNFCPPGGHGTAVYLEPLPADAAGTELALVEAP
jgi:hypothetical protein